MSRRFRHGPIVDHYPGTLGVTSATRNSQKYVHPDQPAGQFRAGFAPAGLREPYEPGRRAIPSSPVLYTDLPLTYIDGTPAVLTEYDQVAVHGKRYDVDGEPEPWQNPGSGRRHGTVVKLKRTAG